MHLSELLSLLEDLQEELGENNDPVIEIHFQQNYPLKGQLENVRELNGKIAIAAGPGTEYGSSEAWEY